MGREIEAILRARGHSLVARLGRPGPDAASRIGPETTGRCDVAFEFTRPEAARENIEALLRSGCRAIVCGTTGWKGRLGEIEPLVASAEAGLVHADNFSLGMAVFERLVREAAGRLGRAGYAPWIAEWHHAGKADAPSGTAGALSRVIEGEMPGRQAHSGPFEGGLPAGSFSVVSVRAGWIPGTHAVGFESEDDAIELTHRARGRGGFAAGAVMAGEWVVSRRGVHTFAECLEDLDRRRS